MFTLVAVDPPGPSVHQVLVYCCGVLLGLSAVAFAWRLPTRPYLKATDLSWAWSALTKDQRKTVVRALRRRGPPDGCSIDLARVHIQQNRTAGLRNTGLMWVAGLQTVSQAAFSVYLALLPLFLGAVVLGLTADHVRQDATFRRWEQAHSSADGAGAGADG